MSVTAVAGVALITAALAVVLRQYRPEYGFAVSIAGGIILLLMLAAQLGDLFSQMRNIASKADIDQEWITLLIKALGLCYLVQFAADCCRDAGESSIASRVELAGKVAVVFLAMPLLAQMVDVIFRLIQ